MALSQKHRSTIYQRLEPIIGEEETEALLKEFPAHDLDVPVTKQFVRAEISDVRAEISDVRAELRTSIADLRTEVHRLGNRLFFSLTGVVVGVAGFASALVRFTG